MNNNKNLRGLLWLGSAGALLIIGGIVAILAANWVSVPFFLQVTLALLPLTLSLGAAVWYWKRKESTIELEEVIGCAWAGSIVCAVALLARILQLPSDGFAFCVTMTVLLTAVTVSMRSTAALVMQVGFLDAILSTRPEVFLWSSDGDGTLLITMLLCSLLVLPRFIELWKRTSVSAIVLRYFASIWCCIHLLALNFLFEECAPFWHSFLNLTLGTGLLFLLAVWVEQRRAAWDRPLMCFSMLFMGIVCVTDCFIAKAGLHWIEAVLVFVLFAIFIRKIGRSEFILAGLVPAVLLFSPKGINFMLAFFQGIAPSLELAAQPGHWAGNILIILIATTILIVGLIRGSRFVANFSMLFLLAFCFSLLAQYSVSLMTLGFVFIACGFLFWVINFYFARLAERMNNRFPTLATPYYFPTYQLSPKVCCITKRIFCIVGLICCLAQIVVPTWMLIKRHIILTKGERIELTVSIFDPRDFFAGKYVYLDCQNLPEALKECSSRNYLRYYCDERYAGEFENSIRDNKSATLIVRLWRKQALAEALFIDGEPAYEYVRRKRVIEKVPVEGCGEVTILCTPQKAATQVLVDGDSQLLPAWVKSRSMLVPVLTGIDSVWDELLIKTGAVTPRHVTAIPHPAWMDLWISGQLVPQEAFLPVTSHQREKRFPERQFFAWGTFSENAMLPIFTGLPQNISSSQTFDELARQYYEILVKRYRESYREIWDGENVFSVLPPTDRTHAQQIFTAFNLALPEAHWYIFATSTPLPEGFPWDLPLDRFTVITPTPPTKKEIAWIYAPTSGTPLQTIVNFCNDEEGNCEGWLNDADSPTPTPQLYWERCDKLFTDASTTYNLEKELIAVLKARLQQTTKTTPEDQECYAVVALWVRQYLAEHPTDEIAQQWLQRIETLSTYNLKRDSFDNSQSAEDFAQWHLRNYRTLPDWKMFAPAQHPIPLSREDWEAFINYFFKIEGIEFL